MTIADELLKAADTLAERASKATPGRWKLWAMEVRADIDGTSDLDTSLPVARTFHESGLRTWNAMYIAAMEPQVGNYLAAALRSRATRYQGHSDKFSAVLAGLTDDDIADPLVLIARSINGGAS